MNLNIHTNDLDSLYSAIECRQLILPSNQKAYSLPIHNGSGIIERQLLRVGMEMNWFHAQTNEPISLSCDVRYPHLELFYPLSGDGLWGTNGKEFSLAANTSNFLFAQNTKIYSELTPKEKVVMMELRIDLRHFKQLLTENKHLFKQSFFCQQISEPSHIHRLIEQIKNCPYTGMLKQLYIEGKALELLTLHLNGIELEENKKKAGPKLNQADIHALYHAKEILNNCWRTPPSILALAKMIGLNDYKLKYGFKELFGTTVFGYVRDLRMLEARKILEHGKANVSETALMVGYQNLSHFATLFRKTFGYNPSDLIKK
ncbi:AraC family transcriptional regulator [Metasolibacillus meyeri]|uniref:AraC family transcriptional regulator n=1 Tax=Metasolibacillus meyeri TaxID=1071052 RepID=A0AAW9NYJ1_9BACL|nr:AraC family transcriptional regulator [Metasolibacillus meyeri]MEC1180513.1 AraC family transcriptional regulator [Metasolibacillus meyeri]